MTITYTLTAFWVIAIAVVIGWVAMGYDKGNDYGD